MEKMKASREEALMVGDGVFDIKCANNAGVKVALVGWRITDADNSIIKDAVTDFETETPEDLKELIERL